MRRRNAQDSVVRILERRVLGGDLSAVPALARVYERMGKRPIDLAPHPVVRQALTAAADVLGTASSTDDDADYWGEAGDGFKAIKLVELAGQVLDGKDVDIEASVAALERHPAVALVTREDRARALVERLEAAQDAQDAVDDMIYDHVGTGRRASEINNSGFHGQIAALVRAVGIDEVERLVNEAIGSS